VFFGEGYASLAKEHDVVVTPIYVSMETLPWKRHMVRSQIWRKAVEAWAGDIEEKIGDDRTVSIGVTVTSCFMARDALPWKRPIVRSQI